MGMQATADFTYEPLKEVSKYLSLNFHPTFRQRPYHVEHTSSRSITEVKQRWAWLVLGWETAWEHQVLLSLFWYLGTLAKKVMAKSFVHRPGIEPGPPAWQASILPLNQRCLVENKFMSMCI